MGPLSASSPPETLSDAERQRAEARAAHAERERLRAARLKEKLKERAQRQFAYTVRENALGGGEDEWAED